MCRMRQMCRQISPVRLCLRPVPRSDEQVFDSSDISVISPVTSLNDTLRPRLDYLHADRVNHTINNELGLVTSIFGIN
jgi:hypothetical protein